MRDDFDEAGRLDGAKGYGRMSGRQDGAGRYTEQDEYEDFDLSEVDLDDFDEGVEDIGYGSEQYSFAKDPTRLAGRTGNPAGILNGVTSREYAGASSGQDDGYGSRRVSGYGNIDGSRGADVYGSDVGSRGVGGYGNMADGRSGGAGRSAGGYGDTGAGRRADEYTGAGRSRGISSYGSLGRGGSSYGSASSSGGGRGTPPRSGQGSSGDNNGRGGQGPSQRSASRAAAQTAKAKRKKRLIMFAVAEFLALICIFCTGYVARRMALVQRPTINTKDLVNPELTVAKQEHMKGYWTFAVFGVDSRGNNVTKGTNADVNMICSVNMDTGEIRMVSVYRDTYFNISDGNSYSKLNSAYANGGPDQALKALNKNLDLSIKEYVTFNWKAVADGINILGGVDVDISKAEFDYINAFITETVKATGLGANQLKKAGPNHLNGVQAVAYGRLRLMDTDYARTERQRLIISKAFEKAKKADYAALNNILVTCLPQTATNLDFADLTNMALGFSKYHLGESTGFPFSKGSLIMGGKGDCVIPQTLESNVVELHKFLYDKENYEPTDTVKKISAKIAADSGMYKDGKNSGKTNSGGNKKQKPTEEKETEETSGETEETSEGVDVPGMPLETDEYGNPIEVPTESESGTENPGLPTRPGETRPGETKPGETRPGETKPGETRPGESKPSETKPTETRPGETRPGDTTRPGETRPGTVQPGQTEPGTTEPGESSSGPTRPSETDPTKPTSSPNENNGPGIQPTEPATEATKPNQPGDTGATAAPTVAPPPVQPGEVPGGSETSPSGVSGGPGASM